MLQKKSFLEFEGDSWYNRNKNYSYNNTDVHLIRKYIERIDGNILEIGCSCGSKLAAVANNNSAAFGIDPSNQAIQEGRKKYPNLNIKVGTADKLEFDDCFFEIVIFGFCLYLVDRNLLFKVVSEADRVLKTKGFLIITDFDPPAHGCVKNNYIHYKGMWSYKMRYHELFEANPAYTLVDKISYTHQSPNFSADIQERVATTVLYKDIDLAYVL